MKGSGHGDEAAQVFLSFDHFSLKSTFYVEFDVQLFGNFQ